MTDDAMRLAMAAACPTLFTAVHFAKGGVLLCRNRDSGDLPVFPDDLFDPLTDLNAMNEAEKELTRAQRVKFVEELCMLVGVKWRPTSHFDTIHATTAQRVPAFLKAKGVWKD